MSRSAPLTLKGPLSLWLIAVSCLLVIGGLYSRTETSVKEPQFKQLLSLKAHMPVAKLRSVQVIFRHGSRTPIADYAEGPLRYYPKVQWNPCQEKYPGIDLQMLDAQTRTALPFMDKVASLPGKCIKGQLTQVGYQQALDLGRWLRNRYVDQLALLPSMIQSSMLSARTTRWSRTFYTLKGVLTGLTGPRSNVSVAAVAVSKDLDEVMYGSDETCPALEPIFKQLQEELDWQGDQRSQRRLKLQVARALGLEGKSIHWTQLYDEVAAMRALNISVKGLSTDVWNILLEQATRYEVDSVAPPLPCKVDPSDTCKTVLQLSMGRLLDMVLSNIESCASTRKGACPTLVHFFSGHDTTLIPLLEVLRQEVTEWPPFASHIEIELWQFTSHRKVTSHYVRILYNKQELQLRNSASLGTYLPVDDFRQRLKPYLLTAAEHLDRCRTDGQEFG